MRNMRMHMQNVITIPTIILTLSFFALFSSAQENSNNSEDLVLDSEIEFDRNPHDLGLGKRVLGYISEYKRIPVYNFGLGKRSHSYNFGLGKRSKTEADLENLEEYDEYPYNDEDQMPELELYSDDEMQSMDKRNKLYSFGLGKRLHRYDFGLGKRGQFHKYDFGLGKRAEATSNRNKMYDFGLGKRNRLYSFGLGKRPYNNGPIPSRFNFGLGKRSEEFDISRNVISKRDVHEQNLQQKSNDNNKAVMDLAKIPTNNLEKLNNSAEFESHEIMGHPNKSQLSKRSPYNYSSDFGKNTAFRPNTRFSRQFRRPLYNFGLGKRMSSLNDAQN